MQRNSELYTYLRSLNTDNLGYVKHFECYLILSQLSEKILRDFNILTERKTMPSKRNGYLEKIYMYEVSDIILAIVSAWSPPEYYRIDRRINGFYSFVKDENISDFKRYDDEWAGLGKLYGMFFLTNSNGKFDFKSRAFGSCQLSGIDNRITLLFQKRRFANSGTLEVNLTISFCQLNRVLWRYGEGFKSIINEDIKREILMMMMISRVYGVPNEISHIIYEYILNT